MSAERMQISVEEFLKYLLKKWKIIVGIVIVSTALFVVLAIVAGDEISVPHSEEYLYYEQELEWHEDYLEKSILMNLNPTHIYQRTLFLRNVSDKELLGNYAVSTDIWEDLETERSKIYISELVSWQENETGTIELTLRHATEEECLETAEYLKEKILVQDPAAEIMIGAETIVADEALQELQLDWYNRIEYLNNMLFEAQAGFTLKVDMTATIIMGVFSGAFLAVVLLVIVYLFDKNRSRGN